MCFGTPDLCICQPMQDFLNDYFQKKVAEIRKTKKVLSMPDDASPDSSLAAPWTIKNFHGFHGIDSVCFARHCEEHLNTIVRCNLPPLNQLQFYHPNVDQVSLSPNSSFFRSCSLGGAQCGLHHGVLRECWLLCAHLEVAQDGALAPWIEEVPSPAFTVWKISRSGICVCMDCRSALFLCFHILDGFLIWGLWHFIWHFGHTFLGEPPYTFVLCRSGWSGKLPIFAASWSMPCCCASVLNLQGARRFAFWSSSCTSWWLMKATAAI